MLRLIQATLKFILVITGSIFLSTLAINAADSLKNPANSLLAGVFSGTTTFLCPSDMVHVGSESGGYCIDLYENSASLDCDFSNPKKQEETRANITKKECLSVSVSGATPWRNISQNQAVNLCAKSGKRLPTNEEWYKASLGTVDPSMGWSNSDCNVNKNRDSFDPSLTGAGKNCVSSAGAYDMIGNVWEWVGETIRDGKFKENSLPEGGFVVSVDERGIPTETNATTSDPNYNDDRFWLKKEGTVGMFRGGFWASGADAGVYTLHAEMSPSFVGNAVGFRCVK